MYLKKPPWMGDEITVSKKFSVSNDTKTITVCHHIKTDFLYSKNNLFHIMEPFAFAGEFFFNLSQLLLGVHEIQC